MRSWFRRALASLLLAGSLASCGGGSGPGGTTPSTTYRLRLSADAGEPHSALVSLGGISGQVTVVAGTGVLARVGDGTSPLVLLVGPLADRELLEVTTATPGTPPSVAIVDASAGATAGYRRLAPGAVSVEWVAVD